MKTAADELRSGKKDGIINTTISTDSSWQRRGFSSKWSSDGDCP